MMWTLKRLLTPEAETLLLIVDDEKVDNVVHHDMNLRILILKLWFLKTVTETKILFHLWSDGNTKRLVAPGEGGDGGPVALLQFSAEARPNDILEVPKDLHIGQSKDHSLTTLLHHVSLQSVNLGKQFVALVPLQSCLSLLLLPSDAVIFQKYLYPVFSTLLPTAREHVVSTFLEKFVDHP